MTYDINEQVDLVLGGLHSSDANDVLRRLDAELQEQVQAGALSATLETSETQPWLLGGESAGGFGSMAQRFLNFYADAIHREICATDNSGLKPSYTNVLSGLNVNEQVKALVPVVLTALGIGASFINPVAIGALVALWLVRVGLNQWCTLPRPGADRIGDGEQGLGDRG